mmetsp:Transcript_32098/g.74673  ORF Transcript_32098/g.74673 Transcript_32098/m.74673 type:complete len:219 (-) Transcript_32098:2392-3048(-)
MSRDSALVRGGECGDITIVVSDHKLHSIRVARARQTLSAGAPRVGVRGVPRLREGDFELLANEVVCKTVVRELDGHGIRVVDAIGAAVGFVSKKDPNVGACTRVGGVRVLACVTVDATSKGEPREGGVHKRCRRPEGQRGNAGFVHGGIVELNTGILVGVIEKDVGETCMEKICASSRLDKVDRLFGDAVLRVDVGGREREGDVPSSAPRADGFRVKL